MARPNEPDTPPKRTKKVLIGIYPTQIQIIKWLPRQAHLSKSTFYDDWGTKWEHQWAKGMQGTGLLKQDETKDEPEKKRKGKFNASQANFHNILEMNVYHVNKNEDA